ncbi:hypothetical protein C1Y63_06510 [Corynebacterium sp. 13CS0277]|uniref:hypothetical protein n=1 Tax=Corynebacterium sp. 13CS0277 TaxID=2071994 RepID=UPI000D04184E|nr:hypothetical protein [Corynebacterium sp. 13CS0277]PRQ11356.1 hypothetical protein C1Y63_06510 [Corynebacterium sp. 13CS0277]
MTTTIRLRTTAQRRAAALAGTGLLLATVACSPNDAPSTPTSTPAATATAAATSAVAAVTSSSTSTSAVAPTPGETSAAPAAPETTMTQPASDTPATTAPAGDAAAPAGAAADAQPGADTAHVREDAPGPLPDDGLGAPATSFIVYPSDEDNPQPTVDAVRQAAATAGITLSDVRINGVGDVVAHADQQLTRAQADAFMGALRGVPAVADVAPDGLLGTAG